MERERIKCLRLRKKEIRFSGEWMQVPRSQGESEKLHRIGNIPHTYDLQVKNW